MKIDKRLTLTFIIAFSLLLVVFSTYITSAFLLTGTYKLSGGITTGGSVNLTNYTAGVLKNVSMTVVGQPVVGIASNGAANLKMCFGVFCTDFYQPTYSINFTGFLNFSNGSVVANSPITFTINYFGAEVEGKNFTDSSGNFFVKIDNLPEYMIKKDLNVSIKVESDIEAFYECYYNYSLGKCCKQPLTTC